MLVAGAAPLVATSALSYLYAFAEQFNAIAQKKPRDPKQLKLLRGDLQLGVWYHILHPTPRVRHMTACAEDTQFALLAWERMQADGRWSPKHTAAVRTALGRALLVHVPGLAELINPLGRPVASTAYVTTTSHEGRFRLHDCLPVRLRRMAPWQTETVLIRRLVEEFATHLRSLSRGNLLKLAGWLDRLLWGSPPGPWWGGEETPGSSSSVVTIINCSVESCWSRLQEYGPRDWLVRYSAVTAPQSLCFTLFKRQMHWLRLLHSRVLRDGKKGDGDTRRPTPPSTTIQSHPSHSMGLRHHHPALLLTIPTPRPSGRLIAGASGGWCDDGSSNTHLSSSETSGLSASATCGSSEEDESHRRRRLDLRDALFALQERVVRPGDAVAEATRRYSFTCEEVRRIITAARSHLERVVVMIFLKTGLRLGGLSRLQLPTAMNRPGLEEAIPEVLTTIEKNGRLRRVLLPPVCRLLVTNWLYERGPSDRGGWKKKK